MKIIVGLGNPGKKHTSTKHNIGFLVIDEIVSMLEIKYNTSSYFKFNAFINEIIINEEKILLVKPLTYMNLSGEAVKMIFDNFNIQMDELIIVYDDLDLPIGKIRFREKGSAGGHRGVISIIQNLDTEVFKRVKIGIGSPQDKDIINYVLTEFNKDQKLNVSDSIVKVSEGLISWIKGKDYKGIMKNYN